MKFVSKLLLLAFALVISSCVKVEQNKEVEIVAKCSNLICSFELAEVDEQVTTDILGRNSVRVLNQRPLSNISANIQWSVPQGTIAVSTTLSTSGLPSCQDDTCTAFGNPTGFRFDESGTYDASVSGTVLFSNGGKEEINKITAVTVQDLGTLPTQITLNMPTNSTMSAIEAAALFPTAVEQGHIEEVIGNNATNTLTFVCKDGFFIDPVAFNTLADGQSNNIFDWPQVDIDDAIPEPLFTGSNWGQITGFLIATNNTVLGTGINCGKLH